MLGKIGLRIKFLPGTEEYKVIWTRNGRQIEKNSYYTGDKEDARLTMADMARRVTEKGHSVAISGAISGLSK